MRDQRMASFRFYPSDFMNDPHVLVMDAAQRGVYIALLCAAWEMERPGVLPGDDRSLMRLARATPREWKWAKQAVARCFDASDDQWVQRRMVSEHQAQTESIERFRRAGRMGGRALRKPRSSDAQATLERKAKHSGSDASSDARRSLKLSSGSPGSPGTPGSPEESGERDADAPSRALPSRPGADS